jgi:hypothetical protein
VAGFAESCIHSSVRDFAHAIGHFVEGALHTACVESFSGRGCSDGTCCLGSDVTSFFDTLGCRFASFRL